ncbi:MAG: NAD(P)/FAD-dependent oxidoreductase [Bacteroidetes bacterium]|nr:MAG: NAD(P)/FAD-dependent oxidoreductase [Bacteroidota bacterium]
MSNFVDTRIPDIGKPRVVIVGGGFAGLELVKALRYVDVQVVLFDKNNHHTFQPLLYQVATSGLETTSIVYPFRKKFGKQRNFYFRLGEVLRVNTAETYIETSVGALHYDYLVLATGTITNFHGMNDIGENSFSLKSIQDAVALRNRIIKNFELALLAPDDESRNAYMDYIIVGGGPTGVEVAGALAELKNRIFPRDYPELNLLEMDIHVVESGDRLLGVMSEPAGRKSQEFLERMGVKIHLKSRIKAFDGNTATFHDDTKMRTKTLIWAAGVTGKPLEGLPTEAIVRGNRLKVNEFNQVAGFENIFALGDIGAMITTETPNGHPQLAPPAMQQARLLAKNLKNKFKNKPMKPFKYNDQGSMATVGRNRAVVDLKGFKFQGFFAWFVWMFVHLMSIVGFKNRLLVLMSWMWSYFSYDRSNRLIIGNLGQEDYLNPQDAEPTDQKEG